MRIEAKEAPAPSVELATISAIQAIIPADFFKPNGSAEVLANLKAEVRKQAAALDISTENGRAAIASLAYKVARSKTALDEQGKSLVEAIKKTSGEIDAERRKVREELDALKEEVRKPLTDWENAEKARVACHEEAINILRNLSMTPARDCVEVAEHIEKANNLFAQRDWQEFGKRALDAKSAVLFELGETLKGMQAREAALIEAARLDAEARERAIKEREEAAAKAAKEAAERKAEEQARLAREAAEAEHRRIESERIEAEARAKQAEAQRIAAEEKAARDLREAEVRRKAEEEAAASRLAYEAKQAEVRAQQAAERARRDQEAAIEAERKRVADEARKVLEEAEARERNKAHKSKINREAKNGLISAGIPADLAEQCIVAIAKGLVPNVRIEY